MFGPEERERREGEETQKGTPGTPTRYLERFCCLHAGCDSKEFEADCVRPSASHDLREGTGIAARPHGRALFIDSHRALRLTDRAAYFNIRGFESSPHK